MTIGSAGAVLKRQKSPLRNLVTGTTVIPRPRTTPKAQCGGTTHRTIGPQAFMQPLVKPESPGVGARAVLGVA
jgi:hypothetical protein